MPMPELQDIFRLYGEEYLSVHNQPPHVWKAIRAIKNCRTAVLGGHADSCDECGYMKISYNSCRNRHCPKCQALTKERWVIARESELLPVTYFHVVFSFPEELNSIVIHNRTKMFNLLFSASAETLRKLALDGKYLGAETGFTSILHTWGSNLTFHPHVHIVIPGGGLTAGSQWKNSRWKFFIPVKVLASLFRGKFMSALQNMRHELRGLEDDGVWRTLANTLYSKDWYVYCKKPFKTCKSVLKYLGRYTHRIAISNQRILRIQDNLVSFKWRDYNNRSIEKVMTLDANEFIRRFLMHVLPPGFTKIRHYGFLASAVKKKKLQLCKALTGAKTTHIMALSAVDLMKRLTGKDITLCPYCGVGHFTIKSGLSPPSAA
jgi:hypothetical protein